MPSQGTKAKARARTRTQQSIGFFVCHFFVLHFQGSSFQHQQVQYSLPAAIWTLIRQQLPATTLKMRLSSLLLSAHRLILMTMTFKLCPPPPAAAEASNHNKREKSSNGDDQQSKQKTQRKLLAISNKKQKRPAISDVDLEKQLNWVRDASLQNVVDSSLQATQAPDLGINDSSDKDVTEVTNYFTMDITLKRSSPWWEGFEQFIPIKHPTLYKEYVLCKECSTFHKNSD